ncbi:RagB/SusD family nutrient uptake outer membrane protein [Pedobacter sp. SYP-B3415]|uniref:RagB/SusD family nutrient uptake outer membrane protein n=1 Tax=Pedobacter sp. SYP-B3415 TaxID=2496641 RepID=UPI00101CC6B0|nr:RagB/SusD family nutrient uptake outer membrane protein [Pedobacter sp. SYP-B3415]
MKRKRYAFALLLVVVVAGSCRKDLLKQNDPSKLTEEGYFTKPGEATAALLGVYVAAREMHYKTYAWDGGSEMMYSRINGRPYSNYTPGNNFGSSASRHWNDGYRCINRANYVLVNVRAMIARETVPANLTILRRVEGEALFLRALAYFRLIDLWGDVPFYEGVLNGNDEAYSLTRSSKTAIKDKILADLDLAAQHVPVSVPKADQGRATRAAIIGYRGKIKLYWACWQKNAGNTTDAQAHYQAAAADFAEIMKPAYGRTLYKGGDPGPATAPFYGELFNGANEDAAYASEVIFAFTNGGPLFGASDYQSDQFYGDTYLYDFGTRSTGAGGVNVAPTMRLVNRYQLVTTGDFAPPLVPLNPTTVADARTRLNSAVNPASYAGRDFRLKATVMWDGESINEILADGTVTSNVLTFLYKTNAPTPPYMFADGAFTGYLYRKYIRQISGYARENGPQDSWMMRLPDVWLMYCEAINELSGPTAETYDLIDKIRRRGGLPPLDRGLFAGKAAFFNAIEQERIIELAAEGSRFFDIRRWNKVEQIWTQPNGNPLLSTWNELVRDEFRNAIERDFQRFYIFQIPTAEIVNNPKIKQNEPWL